MWIAAVTLVEMFSVGLAVKAVGLYRLRWSLLFTLGVTAVVSQLLVVIVSDGLYDRVCFGS